MQTNEEAQVYVHDLELFVTVQILDDTPAVLSLGELCEEHGKTNEWASVLKPRLNTGRKTCAKRKPSQLVFCIATAGLFKFIFKSSKRAK